MRQRRDQAVDGSRVTQQAGRARIAAAIPKTVFGAVGLHALAAAALVCALAAAAFVLALVSAPLRRAR